MDHGEEGFLDEVKKFFSLLERRYSTPAGTSKPASTDVAESSNSSSEGTDMLRKRRKRRATDTRARASPAYNRKKVRLCEDADSSDSLEDMVAPHFTGRPVAGAASAAASTLIPLPLATSAAMASTSAAATAATAPGARAPLLGWAGGGQPARDIAHFSDMVERYWPRYPRDPLFVCVPRTLRTGIIQSAGTTWDLLSRVPIGLEVDRAGTSLDQMLLGPVQDGLEAAKIIAELCMAEMRDEPMTEEGGRRLMELVRLYILVCDAATRTNLVRKVDSKWWPLLEEWMESRHITGQPGDPAAFVQYMLQAQFFRPDEGSPLSGGQPSTPITAAAAPTTHYRGAIQGATLMQPPHTTQLSAATTPLTLATQQAALAQPGTFAQPATQPLTSQQPSTFLQPFAQSVPPLSQTTSPGQLGQSTAPLLGQFPPLTDPMLLTQTNTVLQPTARPQPPQYTAPPPPPLQWGGQTAGQAGGGAQRGGRGKKNKRSGANTIPLGGGH